MVLSRAQPSMARVDAARRGEEATSAHNRQSLEAMVECQSMSSFSFLAQTLFGSQKLRRHSQEDREKMVPHVNGIGFEPLDATSRAAVADLELKLQSDMSMDPSGFGISMG